MSATQIVGVADLRVVRAEKSMVTLITYALGSCIGLVAYDAVAHVGGLLHYMLPDSTLDSAKGASNPAMFADLGIPLLLQKCCDLGAEKKRLMLYAAGGAEALGVPNTFEIGKRNQLALRKLLWKAGVLLRSESLGGTLSRTIRLEVGTGRIGIRTGGGAEQWIPEMGRRTPPMVPVQHLDESRRRES